MLHIDTVSRENLAVNTKLGASITRNNLKALKICMHTTPDTYKL